MLEIIMVGILIVLIMLVCVILAFLGFLMAYSKLIDKEPKSEPPTISDDERARLELAEKKRLKQEQNFWSYDGFKQE